MMRVALVHDWLTGMRGGERCLEVFCQLFPDAEIFTLLHAKGTVSPTIEKHLIRTSFVQHLPFSVTKYRYYLPVFPFAIKSFDIKGYDLVISSSHCVAKGVAIPDGTCHVSYIHTPMRYVWDQYDAYFAKSRAGLLSRIMMALLRKRLKRWDVSSNSRVHYFLANSQHVARRIESYWGRKATVVYPPVNWHDFQASSRDLGYYLIVTALAPYKRVDLAITAANRMGFQLRIIGSGQEEQNLKSIAGPTVEILGWVPGHMIRDNLTHCKALLFPGEEDFGIVPLEAMASGKPVIAYGKGGVLETVVPINPNDPKEKRLESGPEMESSTISGFSSSTVKPPTGVFFYEQSAEALIDAISLFENRCHEFDSEAIRAHVKPFDLAFFKHRMQTLIQERYDDFRRNHPR